MTKTICAYSSKGGTTKTTTTANLGGLLADYGYKVLLIDADNTQPSLSSYYPLDHQASDGLLRLIKSREISDEMISHTSLDRLDIIYADDEKKELSTFINDSTDGRFRIRRAIMTFVERHPDRYDFILIDTRGAKGELVDSGLIASDIIFSPVPPDKLSAAEFLRGTVSRYREVAESVGFLNIKLAPIFAFMSRVDNTLDAGLITRGIRKLSDSAQDVYLLKTEIPSSTAYKSSATARTPVHLYDTKQYGRIQNGATSMIQLWEDISGLYRQLNPAEVMSYDLVKKGGEL